MSLPRHRAARPSGRLLGRRTVVGGLVLTGIGLLPTVAQGAPSLRVRATPVASPTVRARLTRERLDATICRALGAVHRRVGVTVIDRRTGVWHSHNGFHRFEMASTAKVIILVAFLRRRRAQGRALTSFDRSLVEAMIRRSDNAAANRLWSAAGGRAGLAETARVCRMPVTARSLEQRAQWGRAETTSDEQARLLLLVAGGGGGRLHPADCRYVLDEMRQVSAAQAWGAGTVRSSRVSVAVKNGWAPLSPDQRWRVNTLGVVRGDGRDYVIACYERGLRSLDTGVARKNAVARSVHRELAQRLHAR